MAKPPVAVRPYESLFICTIDTPQETVDAFIEKIKTTLTAEIATLKSVQIWGRRRLTYPIKRQKEGIYIYIDFDGPATTVASLNTLYRVTEFVVRSMTVIREEAPPHTVPSSVPVSAPRSAVEPVGATTAAATPVFENKEAPSPKKET